MKALAKPNPTTSFGGLNLILKPNKSDATPAEDEPLRTLIVGNLGDYIAEEVLFELFLQAGPLVGIRMPRDKSTNRPHGMAFVIFRHAISVDFAMRLMSGIRLYGRELQLTKMGGDGNHQRLNAVTTSPVVIPSPPPSHFNHGNPQSGHRDVRSHHACSPSQPAPPPLLMAPPPPPLFAMTKPASFANHTPMPQFRPPLYSSLSEPSRNHIADLRGPQTTHSGLNDRSRHGHGGNYHTSHKDQTPTRQMSYPRPHTQTRANNWR